MKEKITFVIVWIFVWIVAFNVNLGIMELNLWLNSSWHQVFFNNWRWWNIVTSPIDTIVYLYKVHSTVWAILNGFSSFLWASFITGLIFDE